MHCLTTTRGIGLTPCHPSHLVLLTELLTPDRVVVPLASRDKSGVIAELTRHLSRAAGA